MFIKNQILERNAFLFQKMFILEEKELQYKNCTLIICVANAKRRDVWYSMCMNGFQKENLREKIFIK